ncbi:MAG: acyl carrier protein [Selenomonas sp.]|nr:acyl carrier protein [Selenomonas sp.]
MSDESGALLEMREIIRDVFDDDSLDITESTCAKDIEDWDSIAQMDIVLAVERHFCVRFRPEEIASFKNVGDMLKLVQARRKE